MEYVRLSSGAVRQETAGLEQRQRAQEEETRMPSAIEPFPREANKRNKHQRCENLGSLAGKPTHEEAEGGGSDGGQVSQHLKCGPELGRCRGAEVGCRRRVHGIGSAGGWLRVGLEMG